MKNKNIFITGASGFIGKNLTEHLSGRANLFIPTHQELELLDEQAVLDYIVNNHIDVVIHCGNIGATRRTDSLRQIVGDNLRMFLNLFKAKHLYEKMIFFGSGAEFDKRDDLSKISEDYISQRLPVSEYGLSKYLCSHFIEHADNIVNLRMFGVYGKYDDYQNRFITNAICRAVLGLPIIIYQDAEMDFIFVDDLVKITDHFIQNKVGNKFYNIGTGKSFRLVQIAQSIKDISGKNIEIIIKKSGMAPEYTCNNQRLLKEIPGLTFTDMEQSLRKLYDWYSLHKAEIMTDKFID
ncbi:MAG: NAD-dependent epimerase/dehydratase family protein [Candidatus Doudnabacteria bacterium]|jgi:GDP-L-fucose synthase